MVVFELCVNGDKWWIILWFFNGLIEWCCNFISGFMVGCYHGLLKGFINSLEVACFNHIIIYNSNL